MEEVLADEVFFEEAGRGKDEETPGGEIALVGVENEKEDDIGGVVGVHRSPIESMLLEVEIEGPSGPEEFEDSEG